MNLFFCHNDWGHVKAPLECGPWATQIAYMDGALHFCTSNKIVLETVVVTEKLFEAAT